jgi:hypothetical protein
MDLDGIVEKIPSTEKILGVIWITSWICAIWVYHLQFFLTGLFCLFLIFILVGRFEKNEENINPKPPAVLMMDKSTKTLTVQKIYENDLKWEQHEICSGSAEMPNGQIKKGDKITNCKGNIALRHIPTNTLIGGFDFEN